MGQRFRIGQRYNQMLKYPYRNLYETNYSNSYTLTRIRLSGMRLPSKKPAFVDPMPGRIIAVRAADKRPGQHRKAMGL
jgi:hypothetical protein